MFYSAPRTIRMLCFHGKLRYRVMTRWRGPTRDAAPVSGGRWRARRPSPSSTRSATLAARPSGGGVSCRFPVSRGRFSVSAVSGSVSQHLLAVISDMEPISPPVCGTKRVARSPTCHSVRPLSVNMGETAHLLPPVGIGSSELARRGRLYLPCLAHGQSLGGHPFPHSGGGRARPTVPRRALGFGPRGNLRHGARAHAGRRWGCVMRPALQLATPHRSTRARDALFTRVHCPSQLRQRPVDPRGATPPSTSPTTRPTQGSRHHQGGSTSRA